jgi:hypothetical protein
MARRSRSPFTSQLDRNDVPSTGLNTEQLKPGDAAGMPRRGFSRREPSARRAAGACIRCRAEFMAPARGLRPALAADGHSATRLAGRRGAETPLGRTLPCASGSRGSSSLGRARAVRSSPCAPKLEPRRTSDGRASRVVTQPACLAAFRLAMGERSIGRGIALGSSTNESPWQRSRLGASLSTPRHSVRSGIRSREPRPRATPPQSGRATIRPFYRVAPVGWPRISRAKTQGHLADDGAGGRSSAG